MVDYFSNKNYVVRNFTMYGELREFSLKSKIFNCHIIAVNYVDNLKEIDNKLLVEDKVIYEYSKERKEKLKEEFYKDSGIRSSMYQLVSIDQKISVLLYRKYIPYAIDSNDTKNIFLSSLGELFILKNDGTLLKDNVVYEKDVEDIWTLDTYTTFVIFKDNRVEYLTSKSLARISYAQKVVYTDYFIAILENNVLDLYIKQDRADTSIFETFACVENIVYDDTKEEFRMYVNGTYITLDIEFASVISN